MLSEINGLPKMLGHAYPVFHPNVGQKFML